MKQISQTELPTSVYHRASGLRKTGRTQQQWTFSNDSAMSETLSQPGPLSNLKYHLFQYIHCTNGIGHVINSILSSQRSRLLHYCWTRMNMLV